MPSGERLPDAVHARLTDDIVAGRLPVGARLPSERELARTLHASRGSVRRALLRLRQQGLVDPAPQSGWFVADDRLGEPPSTLISFTEMAARRNMVATSRVLTSDVREPSFDEVAALGVAVTDRVLFVSRLRLLDGAPVCIDRSVICLGRVPGLRDVDLTDRSLYAEMTALGCPPYRSDFTVEAGAATRDDATLLDIASGTPVLVTDERCFSRDGTVLLSGRTVYRANAYRFHATLRAR